MDPRDQPRQQPAAAGDAAPLAAQWEGARGDLRAAPRRRPAPLLYAGTRIATSSSAARWCVRPPMPRLFWSTIALAQAGTFDSSEALQSTFVAEQRAFG